MKFLWCYHEMTMKFHICFTDSTSWNLTFHGQWIPWYVYEILMLWKVSLSAINLMYFLKLFKKIVMQLISWQCHALLLIAILWNNKGFFSWSGSNIYKKTNFSFQSAKVIVQIHWYIGKVYCNHHFTPYSSSLQYIQKDCNKHKLTICMLTALKYCSCLYPGGLVGLD